MRAFPLDSPPGRGYVIESSASRVPEAASPRSVPPSGRPSAPLPFT